MNLYDDGSTEPQIMYHQRISTRLYIAIVFTSLITIICWTAMVKTETFVKVENPSIEQYQRLEKQYSTTLECPCNQISTDFTDFLNINATFHQICSSILIQDDWIEFLFGNMDWSDHYRADIRIRGGSYFRLLSQVCHMAQYTVEKASEEFIHQGYLSTQALPKRLLYLQIESHWNHYKNYTAVKFSRSLELIREMTHGNNLVSSTMLNWNYEITDDWFSPSIIPVPVVMNGDCSCATRHDCIESAVISDEQDWNNAFIIPGWYIGCSVLDTLLKSTPECFFNQTCYDLFTQRLIVSSNLSFLHNNVIYKMNTSLVSRFSFKASFEELARELFIEQWNLIVNYTNFYERCSPDCTYLERKANSFSFIVVRILGFYGGLTTIVRFISPHLIMIYFKIRNFFHSKFCIRSS